jgi:hypothetical protein
MTHDELLARLDNQIENSKVIGCECLACDNAVALRAVVKLHTPIYDNSCFDLDCCGGPYHDLCDGCGDDYPCPTIQAIEKELT